MNQIRIPIQTWALLVVSVLLLMETFFVVFPAQDRPDPRSPIVIKFTCANGTGMMRLDIDRNLAPKLEQSINLRSDLTMWMPRGAVMHYEGPEEDHGIPVQRYPYRPLEKNGKGREP
jgi:hypothetical protein